jgi:hypothetical protein
MPEITVNLISTAEPNVRIDPKALAVPIMIDKGNIRRVWQHDIAQNKLAF